jgi:hypothetical protein
MCPLTVSQRGLFAPAEWLALRHPYPELVIEPNNVEVPVMDIAEQAAEKVVGWAAGRRYRRKRRY